MNKVLVVWAVFVYATGISCTIASGDNWKSKLHNEMWRSLESYHDPVVNPFVATSSIRASKLREKNPSRYADVSTMLGIAESNTVEYVFFLHLSSPERGTKIIPLCAITSNEIYYADLATATNVVLPFEKTLNYSGYSSRDNDITISAGNYCVKWICKVISEAIEKENKYNELAKLPEVAPLDGYFKMKWSTTTNDLFDKYNLENIDSVESIYYYGERDFISAKHYRSSLRSFPYIVSRDFLLGEDSWEGLSKGSEMLDYHFGFHPVVNMTRIIMTDPLTDLKCYYWYIDNQLSAVSIGRNDGVTFTTKKNKDDSLDAVGAFELLKGKYGSPLGVSVKNNRFTLKWTNGYGMAYFCCESDESSDEKDKMIKLYAQIAKEQATVVVKQKISLNVAEDEADGKKKKISISDEEASGLKKVILDKYLEKVFSKSSIKYIDRSFLIYLRGDIREIMAEKQKQIDSNRDQIKKESVDKLRL